MAVVLTVSHWRKSRGMLCYPFLCVITLRALQEYGRHTGTQSSTEQQQKGWTVKYPLALLWLWGIYFLSRNMTSAGNKLSLGSISSTAVSGYSHSSFTPIASSHRKERRSHTCTKTVPQASPSMRENELEPFVREGHSTLLNTDAWTSASCAMQRKMIHSPGSCFLVWYLVCHWDEKNKDDCSTLHQKDERVWERAGRLVLV